MSGRPPRKSPFLDRIRHRVKTKHPGFQEVLRLARSEELFHLSQKKGARQLSKVGKGAAFIRKVVEKEPLLYVLRERPDQSSKLRPLKSVVYMRKVHERILKKIKKNGSFRRRHFTSDESMLESIRLNIDFNWYSARVEENQVKILTKLVAYSKGDLRDGYQYSLNLHKKAMNRFLKMVRLYKKAESDFLNRGLIKEEIEFSEVDSIQEEDLYRIIQQRIQDRNESMQSRHRFARKKVKELAARARLLDFDLQFYKKYGFLFSPQKLSVVALKKNSVIVRQELDALQKWITTTKPN